MSESAKLWKKNNPEGRKEQKRRWEKKQNGKRRGKGLKQRTGITEEVLDALINAQNNLCMICKRPFVGKAWDSFAPVIDHDHSCCGNRKSCTKCIRGIIHRKCNVAIGMLEDNPLFLRLAAEYLEKYKCQQKN